MTVIPMPKAISSAKKPSTLMMSLTKPSSSARFNVTGSGAGPDPPKLTLPVRAVVKTLSRIAISAMPAAPTMKKTSRMRRRDSSTSE